MESELKKMQLERKRRAAEFIAKLQKKDGAVGSSNVRPGESFKRDS
jgi:hypothetical protein